jgi:hypothetical protein
MNFEGHCHGANCQDVEPTRLLFLYRSVIVLFDVLSASRAVQPIHGERFFIGHYRASEIAVSHSSYSVSNHPQEFPPRRTRFGNLPSCSILQIVVSLKPVAFKISGFRMIL